MEIHLGNVLKNKKQRFKIDLIVWKFVNNMKVEAYEKAFKIDLIVWK